MITGLLQNEYICISNTCKAKTQRSDQDFSFFNRVKNTALQNDVRLLVGWLIFGQQLGLAATFVYNKSSKKETNVNINSKKNK